MLQDGIWAEKSTNWVRQLFCWQPNWRTRSCHPVALVSATTPLPFTISPSQRSFTLVVTLVLLQLLHNLFHYFWHRHSYYGRRYFKCRRLKHRYGKDPPIWTSSIREDPKKGNLFLHIQIRKVREFLHVERILRNALHASIESVQLLVLDRNFKLFSFIITSKRQRCNRSTVSLGLR